MLDTADATYISHSLIRAVIRQEKEGFPEGTLSYDYGPEKTGIHDGRVVMSFCKKEAIPLIKRVIEELPPRTPGGKGYVLHDGLRPYSLFLATTSDVSCGVDFKFFEEGVRLFNPGFRARLFKVQRRVFPSDDLMLSPEPPKNVGLLVKVDDELLPVLGKLESRTRPGLYEVKLGGFRSRWTKYTPRPKAGRRIEGREGEDLNMEQ